MSCSADYYFVFGLVAPTIILCGMFRCGCTELSKDRMGVIAKRGLYFLLRYTQTLSVLCGTQGALCYMRLAHPAVPLL
jgi:hypothetical protein